MWWQLSFQAPLVIRQIARNDYYRSGYHTNNMVSRTIERFLSSCFSIQRYLESALQAPQTPSFPRVLRRSILAVFTSDDRPLHLEAA